MPHCAKARVSRCENFVRRSHRSLSCADLLDRGILTSALKVDFHRSLLDVTACETFTEAIVTDKQHP